MNEWQTVFNRHRKNGRSFADAAFRADQWEKRKHPARWAYCSSTHCERAQECRGPNDCAASLMALNAEAWTAREQARLASREA